MGIRIFWMGTPIDPNRAEGIIQLSQYYQLLFGLDELQRIWVLGDKTWNTERLTSQTGLCFGGRSKPLPLEVCPRLEGRRRLRGYLRIVSPIFRRVRGR